MKSEIGETLFPPPGKTPREDTAAVMKFYKLPKAFPPAVLKEARAIGAPGAGCPGCEGRLDLRRKFIFTCDPVTARDYDDALSLETDRRGNRVLGVHIADVSHYVKPGSAIDREAYRRSTSVYLCDKVVPMLPEELCNGVCSLVPNEDRFAFSVFMTFDRNGEMVKREFAKSVIRSKARFTYEQVMAVIAGGSGSSGHTRISRTSREFRTIREISALAQQLRAKRFAAGALDLEVPEAEVTLDRNGEMIGIVTRPYDESHQMIEECMVAANEAVAKELWTKGIKILARLHEAPDPEKILLLRSELRGLGVKLGNIGNPKVFGQFLKSIKSHPLYPTIATMVLRSMKKAVYDSTAMGHFGLAKKFYAHFTSPIRRYPDLTLHRQLAAYLANPTRAKVPPKLLAKWAEHTSEMEAIAAEAERGLLEIKKYRLLEEELNSREIVDYEAVVAKCTPFGCFVEIPALAVSGLVHVSQLSYRFVRFNESDQSLSAPGGGSWHVGDKMKVRVARVDFRQRRIDFVPVRETGRRRRGRVMRALLVLSFLTGIVLSGAARTIDLDRLSGVAQWGGREPHPAVVNPACGQDSAAVLSLDGEWDFTTCEREGGREQYHRNGNCSRFYEVEWKNARKIRVPSCWEAQGVGTPGESESWAIHWDVSSKPIRHKFMGTGWYRRSVRIPDGWKGCRIWLKLGGVQALGYVWVNGRQVALTQNYCATEKYEITDLVTPGRTARVTIQADNRAPSRKGLLGNLHRFGGVYRSVELEATPQVFIDDAWVRGDYDRRAAQVKVEIAGEAEKKGGGGQGDGALFLRATVEGETAQVPLSASVASLGLEVPLRNFRPWSPEHPNLYTATVELVENGRVVQLRRERFGVRKLEVRGKDLFLNGRPLFLRGFGDDHIYPLTGLTPADRQTHRRHLAVARAAGFNYVRLHTHCELPEYFDAADELGILVQPELPYYSDEPCERFAFDPKRDVTELFENYRRHPSFAIYSTGNEGSFGPDLDRALHRYVKAMDPDRLKMNQDNHSQAANGPETADILGGPKKIWPRGSVNPDQPFVLHEYMNLCVKSDVRLENRYTGVWQPTGTRAERSAWLSKFGLDAAFWCDRLQNAQHVLQGIWQKRGIEVARTDPYCDGYSFWTVVDVVVWNEAASAYSAQGLFNPFWEQKPGGLSAREFARFNGEKGLFADFLPDRRVFAAGDDFRADVHYCDYGESQVRDGTLVWSFSADGRTLAEGRLAVGELAAGAVRRIAAVEATVPDVTAPVRTVFRLALEGTETCNLYDTWIFPRRGLRDGSRLAVDPSLRPALATRYAKLLPPDRAAEADAVIAPFGSALAAAARARGQRLVTLEGCDGEPNVALGWWWMGAQVGTAFCDHPALAGLPHRGVMDELFFRLVKTGRPLPDAALAGARMLAVGEGGDACYCYLAETDRTLMAFGLDVLSDTPEGVALLDGFLAALGVGCPPCGAK